MASTDFLDFFKNAASGTRINIGTAATRTQENGRPAQTSIAGTNNIIESGTSSSALERISSFLSEGNRLTSVRNQQGIIKSLDTANQNLITLGENQTVIGANQTTFGNKFGEIDNFLAELNQRVSGQLSALGASVTDASKAAGDALAEGQKDNLFQTITGALGTTGLIIAGGLLLLVVLRR